MKAIVTVLGKDRVGIIAGICIQLAQYNINILDISQTIMQGFFTMMMVVDLSACEETFEALGTKLKEYGDSQELSVRIQREDIFDAMYQL